MRTKITTRQVRGPTGGLNAELLKAKFDDLDDALDAINTVVYDEAGAISPNVGLALIDAVVPRQAMTLANGAVVREKMYVKLRNRTAIPAVDPTADTLTFDNHGISTADGPFLVESDENVLPGGIQPNRRYWAIDVNDYTLQLAVSEAAATAEDAVDITSAGLGTINLIRVYDIESVTHGSDSLEITGHGLGVGDEVVYYVRGGTPATGLDNGSTYFVIPVDADNIELATSLANAEAGTQINLTGNGTGTMELRRVVGDIHSMNASVRITPATMAGGTYVDLDATDDRGVLIWTAAGWDARGTGIDIVGGEFTSAAHGITTGDGPFYLDATVTMPGGFTALTEYWGITLSANLFQLADSEDNALAGIPVTIESTGAGTITLTRLVDIEAFTNATDLITATAHGIPDETEIELEEGTGGALPAELAEATSYWAIVGGDPDTLQVASSLANAQADTEINFTDDGTLPARILHLAFKTITAVDPATP